MGKLFIVAGGTSQQEVNQKRGKLFEKLMRFIIEHLGYTIQTTPVVHSGMEIDIEGFSKLNQIPLYCECKCYDTLVDSPKLQQFFGKYMSRWLKNDKSQGIFIALPGINSTAKGYYTDSIKSTSKITFNIIEESDVIKLLLETQEIIPPDQIAYSIPPSLGKPGEWLILYSELGTFYAFYIIPEGSAIPSKISIFDSIGKPIVDKGTIDQLIKIYPEFLSFEVITINTNKEQVNIIEQPEIEEIIEVRGSSSCFEYQFPASPQFFVGRKKNLDDLYSFYIEVLDKRTSSRGLLFEANSGWGKSSLVLASIQQLKNDGHFAIAIDSRTASTSQFILRAIEHAIKRFLEDSEIAIEPPLEPISGFDGATQNLIRLGKELERHNKIFLIYFDQFENVFFLVELLKRITDIFLKIQDAGTNIIFGFSWKTDLVGLTHDFPYRMRDNISFSSKQINLNVFSGAETDLLIDKLADELEIKLRPDLRFLLQEFSQGYPWSLKKLCAHVKTQIENGIQQKDIATRLLLIEELFQDDIKGLSPEEEETLSRIAKSAPISIKELSEEFNLEIIDGLVHRRLLVRIGNSKYDIYWDIFRDYLNTKQIPVKENYLIRTPINTIYQSFKIIIESGGKITRKEFQERTGYHGNTFFNVLKDLRLLKIVTVSDDMMVISPHIIEDKDNIEASFIKFLSEKIRLNRIFRSLLEVLEEKKEITLSDAADLLENACPYIHASEKTWIKYAALIAGWLDFVDFVSYEKKRNLILKLPTGKNYIHTRESLLVRGQSSRHLPQIRYSPIESVAISLLESSTIQKQDRTPSNLPSTTISKAMLELEHLGWIERGHKFINISPDLYSFVKSPSERQQIFRESALKMGNFKLFIDILSEFENQPVSHEDLTRIFVQRLNVNWTKTTASWQMRILFDWARHADLIPKSFTFIRERRKHKPQNIKSLDLF